MSLLYLLYARIAYLRRQRHIRLVEAIWIPVFKPKGTLGNVDVQKIRGWQYPYVLDVWSSYRSLANPKRARALDRVAIELGLDVYISSLLSDTSFRIRRRPLWLLMLAISSARWLRSDAVIDSLWRALESHNKFLAVSACTCLIKLRADEFEKAIIKILFRYPEEAATVTAQIGAAGGAEILHLLHSVLDQLPNYTLKNFISLAERSKDPSLLPILEAELANYRNPEEASALLRSIGHIGSAEQRACLLPFLDHEVSFLRIQAVKSLGRIGIEADIANIEPLLNSEDWWLRYRAAEAIVELCGRDSEYVEKLINKQQDRYAVDILRHAYKEREWCLI